MAESDGQEKTEEPTGRKLDQAKEKGQVPRSKELGTAVVLLAGVIGLSTVAKSLGGALLAVFSRNFSFTREQVFDPLSMIPALADDIGNLIMPLITLFAIVMLAALVGNLLLGGVNVSSDAMMPKMSKLSPMAGFKRMFGMQSWVELIKSIAKVLFIGLLSWSLIMGQLPHILDLSQRQLPYSIYDALELCLWAAVGICCALLPIVAIDVPFQMWNHSRQLRMSKQEIKDEYKDSEGKPEVKGRLRRMQYEMANRRMMAEVPKADVVVTNPTHYAVALKYERDKPGGAPIVLAKGVDEVAMKIREIARECGVINVASPALARAIYHTTKLNKAIPDGLFVAVAQVLAYVYQLQAYKQGRAEAPRKLADELPIPDDLRY
jgi:flagellar biosynthesis protein FlhB